MTIIDIVRAVTELLENNFTYEINDRDLSEGFPRPSFFIDVDSIHSDRNASYLQDDTTISIYFYAENIYTGWLDVLKVQKALRKLLDYPIRVDEYFHLTCEGIDFLVDKDDKALQCTFTVLTVQDNDEPDKDKPYIDELGLNINRRE